MQQSKLLCPKLSNDKRDAGDIAARLVETGDEAQLNRVAAACEDDRDRPVAALATIVEVVSAAITVT